MSLWPLLPETETHRGGWAQARMGSWHGSPVRPQRRGGYAVLGDVFRLSTCESSLVSWELTLSCQGTQPILIKI